MYRLFALLLTLFTAQAVAQYPRGNDAIPLLRETWALAKAQIYPRDLAERFDPATLEELERRLSEDEALALADVLNPFLDTLGVSHTRFFDTRHQTYYMLRSLFTTRDIDSPELHTIGVQLDDRRIGFVRAVLEGSPAAEAGIRRGERIVSVNGSDFSSLLQWQSDTPVELVVASEDDERTVELSPVYQGFHRALADATLSSYQEFACGGRTLAYLHLWTGTNAAFLDALNDAVETAHASGVDGFVLDLRDGYGGAWWEYLDPFFPDRSTYFKSASHSSDVIWGDSGPDPRVNDGYWDGPLVVLINNGTRSGKESLAYQFKRSGRAQLIGSTTAGAFTAGFGGYADRDGSYLLYLSVAEMILDGNRIEGIGVAPDVAAPDTPGHDAALAAALEHFGCGRG